VAASLQPNLHFPFSFFVEFLSTSFYRPALQQPAAQPRNNREKPLTLLVFDWTLVVPYWSCLPDGHELATV